MKIETKEWWKGSFPTWIVAGLMAVNAFFVQRILTEYDGVVQVVNSSRDRILMLESRTKYQDDSLYDLKQTNERIVVELRELRTSLIGVYK